MLEKMTLAEAAEVLGISPDAVRMRIRRGMAQGAKDDDGRWWVWVDREATEAERAEREARQAREQSGEPPNEQEPNAGEDDPALLRREIENLRKELAEVRGDRDYLRRQLENLIMAQTAQAMQAQAGAQKALTDGGSTGSRRGWWARLFGGSA